MGIILVSAFVIQYNQHRLKSYTMGQLEFSCGVIIPIKHTQDYKLIPQTNHNILITKTFIEIWVEETMTTKLATRL